MLIFSYPWLFVLLPLPWLLRRWLPAYRGEAQAALRVPFMARLIRLGGLQSEPRAAVAKFSRLQSLLLGLSWLLVLIALARPQWLEEPLVKTLPMRDMLLAVDLSGSMETADLKSIDGRQVDRLTAVKQVLAEFLARREGDRVGLIFFGSAAFVQAPFTDDLKALEVLLDEAQVRMAGPRTALGDAIGLALTVFERSQLDERVLIVLTDGNDTGSLVPPARAAEIARDRNITIHTVAVGDPAAAGEEALDEQALRDVAATTGGRYFHAADRAELEAIYTTLDELTPQQVESISYRPQRDLFQYPLALMLLLSMGYHAFIQMRSTLAASRAGRQAHTSGTAAGHD